MQKIRYDLSCYELSVIKTAITKLPCDPDKIYLMKMVKDIESHGEIYDDSIKKAENEGK